MTSRQRGWAAVAAMVTLAALHAALAWSVPIRYQAGAVYDEALFMQQAQSIAAGQWLGPYTMLTLAKGCGFSLWLALVHLLHVPLNLAASLGWSAACALMAAALAPLLPARGVRLALFAALLFTPEALGDYGLLRELVYPTLVLAAVAAGLGLALRLVGDAGRVWHWAALLGLASAAAVLTREEWPWLLPLWGAALLAALRAAWRGRWRVAAVAASMALASAALPLLGVAGLNRHHYGVFTLAEVNSRPFTAAVGALTRVRHAGSLPHVPLPRETWPGIAAASPAFAQLLPQLDGPIGERWSGPSARSIGAAIEGDAAVREWFEQQIDQPLPASAPGTAAALLRERFDADGAFRSALLRFLGGEAAAVAFVSGAMEREIGGAFFIWALRDAAAAAGQHADAAAARRFFAQLAAEVNAACERRALDCRSARASLASPLQRVHRQALPAAFVTATQALLTSENHGTAALHTSLGDAAALAAGEAFVHMKLATPNARRAAVQPQEALIVTWRYALPVLAVLALAFWLRQAPLPGRGLAPVQRALWWVAALLLLLVLLRLAMIALIHVSGWPAALQVRYHAPAQPLLVAFIVLAAALQRRRSPPVPTQVP